MPPIQYIVEGGHRLAGTIEPSGNKNAALPIIAAALLTDALDRGFHNLNYQEHNRMSDDPALEPIRSRPRVRELLAHRG